MKRSQPHLASRLRVTSPEKQPLSFSVLPSGQEDSALHSALAGTLNDAEMVRSVMTDAMRRCSKSRVQIAEEMSFLSGTAVTERMLNNFSAESKENRFPAELDRAFCAAVGDTRLLTCRCQAYGLHVIDDTERELLELGRQTILLKRAQAAAQALEDRLAGVAL